MILLSVATTSKSLGAHHEGTQGKEDEHYTANLEKIFAILRLNNLKLNLKKCKLGVRELDWLGFTINNEGIKLEMSKVQKCRELQPPKSAKEIESPAAIYGI